ncbi:MAG: DUF1837 domain-containing protein [Candidatus Lokiarchaeota archaeon]|nr:DUF1837 domain-containing protein [Candidatus Lokiarchaeota archaeon]
MRPFKSELVLEEKISESVFRAYHVGFEENKFRLQPLVDVIRKVIPEFALGYYKGKVIPITQIVDKLQEAAVTVYETEKYQKRGEFGELILHLLLRDFCSTIPLISKIYFKDSNNVTIHGFDGVHITIEEGNKKLWLGESKLYSDGKQGIKDLCNDLKDHIKRDYLRKEFNLIKRKMPKAVPEIEYWRKLMDKYNKLEKIYSGICIPLVCTYSSKLFNKHNSETAEYIKDFVDECQNLNKYLNATKIKTNVEAILMLLPVPDKDKLNKELDKRLKRMQKI